MSSFDHVEKIRNELASTTFHYWRDHVLFTWQWWLLVLLTLLPWYVWWKVVDKQRITELVLYGALFVIDCTLLDLIGMNLVLWGYPIHILWFLVPPIIPIDLCILPVEYMIVYQYFPHWRGYIGTIFVVSALNSFVAEPFFVWSGIYAMLRWHYLFSMPIYFAKGIVAKWLQGILWTRRQAR